MNTLFVSLTVLCLSVSFAHAGEARRLGGPCEYKTYKGIARIVSAEQASEKLSGSPNAYEVKFTFDPEQPVQEQFAQPSGKQYVLTINGSYPGKDLVERNGIKPGKVFDCLMKVITKGTCTPVIFEFPSLDAGAAARSGP